MSDLTTEQRARALEMWRAATRADGVSEYALPGTINEGHARYWLAAEAHVLAAHECPLSDPEARAWLAVRDHVLAAHECPDVEADARVQAWNTIAQHPFFADCYQTEGTLTAAMVAKLDAAHDHTCEPVWRPTTADEIEPGWEIRSRHRNGSEATWGVAHRPDDDGDWYTEAGNLLTLATAGWTYETTAPPPEPWDGELVGLVGDVIGRQAARAVLNLLAERGLIEAERRVTPARNHAPSATEAGSGATQAADWHPNPNPTPSGPQNAETEER